MLFGIGYLGQRLATTVARACGGDEWVQSECRKAAAKVTVFLDPVGTALGMVHEHAKLRANESKTAKMIDETMSTASQVEGLLGWGTTPDASVGSDRPSA